MPSQELAREYLSTSDQTAEINGLRRQDNVIFLNNPKVELSRSLHVNKDLEKAGLHLHMEINRFVEDINRFVSKGETLYEAVSKSAEVFDYHIRSYDAEFIEQNPVLLHLNRFGFWNGEKRVLGNNGRPVVDGIDETERWGAVKRVSEEIEKDLLEEENNSFRVLMSPKGVSGYRDGSGYDVPHINTQTLVFWKEKDGGLKGATLVTDLRVDQAEKVMESLGCPTNLLAKNGTQMQRVVNIVEKYAEPSLPEKYKNPLEYVFDKILEVRGPGDIHLQQKQGKDEIRSVEEIKQKISSFESLLDLSLTKEKFLKEFISFILNNYEKINDPAFQQEIIDKAEITVLRLTRNYRVIKGGVTEPKTIHFQTTYTKNDTDLVVLPAREMDFSMEIAFLQTRAGCPSGVRSLMGRTGRRRGRYAESDSKGSLYVPCPKCGVINKRPYEGFIETCRGCKSDEIACRPKPKKEEKEDGNLKKAA